MDAIIQTIITTIKAMSILEAVAVVLAIAYLLLAIKQSLWCWYCALVSTAIYTVIFWDVSLFMESALNVFYMVMAVYGWWQWRRGGDSNTGLRISRWPLQTHCLVITAVVLLTLVSGYLLAENTAAVLPYIDGFTTWASVVTTWMVAKKILENWLYWLVIDSVSIFLYVDRGLYLTALLFVAYVIIVVFGYVDWKKQEEKSLGLT